VRIAAASAKGLAGALGVDLYACSSLVAAGVASEALAGVPLPDELQESLGGGWAPVKAVERQRRYVLADARRGRVYGACVDVGGGLPLEVVVPPHGGTVVEVLNRRLPLGTCFAGDGARAHASLIRAAGYALLPMPAGVATADGLMAVGAWEGVDRHAWEPDYVREWRPGP
jgi:tRNA A37 threonylcarbamoyladenosine modification protein TsaB